jgi:hypothetical protein
MGCKRFAPSEWACIPEGARKIDLLTMSKTLVWDACEKSGIEWARFNNDIFMNYFGIGCGKREDEACAGINREGDMNDGSVSFLVSMGAGKAELLVGDGGLSPRITLTEIGNVGEFVAAALELKRWETDMNIVGSTIRVDELVALSEETRGMRSDREKLEMDDLRGQINDAGADMLKKMWLQSKLMRAEDKTGEGFLQPTANELCPGVAALGVEMYSKKHWDP